MTQRAKSMDVAMAKQENILKFTIRTQLDQMLLGMKHEKSLSFYTDKELPVKALYAEGILMLGHADGEPFAAFKVAEQRESNHSVGVLNLAVKCHPLAGVRAIYGHEREQGQGYLRLTCWLCDEHPYGIELQ